MRRKVTCSSGITGWECRLQNNYDSFEQFKDYDEIFSLSTRLGYPNSRRAWDSNPVVQGSTNPSDFRKISS